MPIDPSIIERFALNAKPLTFADTMENYSKLMSIRQQQMQMQGAEQQMAQQQQQAQRDAMFRQALSGASSDEDIRKAYMAKGDLKGYMDYHDTASKLQKAKLEAIGNLNNQQLGEYSAALAALNANPQAGPNIHQALLSKTINNAKALFPGIDTSKSDDPTSFTSIDEQRKWLEGKIEQTKQQSMTMDQRLKEADALREQNKPLSDIAKINRAEKLGQITPAQAEEERKKATYRAPAIQVSYGSTPQQGIDPATGKPVTYVVDSKTGNVKVLPFEPVAPKAGTKKVDPEKLNSILNESEKLLKDAKGSWLDAKALQLSRLAGVSNKHTQTQAQLEALQAALMMNMPRMEGPQSDKDVALYEKQAGKIGDPNVPAKDKLAALRIIRTINQQYSSDNAAPKIETPKRKASGASSVDDLMKILGH